jgi:arabinogalactan endo-1,4-beta-galactosidase
MRTFFITGLLLLHFFLISQTIYLGADLSYINEMEDCGGEFRANGREVDTFALFARRGCNLVRVRLWNNPEWSGYSDYEDVEKTIRRAKDNKMETLLDFHYSDTWADPQHQVIPAAWKSIKELPVLGDSLYNFTYTTLMKLYAKGLLPEFVQVGNEVNIEIMQPEDRMNVDSINWARNIFLLNRGISAVKDVAHQTGSTIRIMIHIAQPENALWWFEAAEKHGLEGYEWIGLSYYPKWSVYKFDEIPSAIDSLRSRFDKKVMIVETAYPFTFSNADEAGNILGEDAVIPGYPATPEGQLNYMTDLVKLTLAGGGEGVIYWEPAWISTKCSTPWGKGSHWDNAIFFDAAKGNEALPAFGFFDQELYK